MANIKLCYLLLFFFNLMLAARFTQGSRTQVLLPYHHQKVSQSSLQGSRDGKVIRNSMIGSTAPTCTYNECRGCKYKCRAEQVPVEGNDPMNSAYHYKCVCHR